MKSKIRTLKVILWLIVSILSTTALFITAWNGQILFLLFIVTTWLSYVNTIAISSRPICEVCNGDISKTQNQYIDERNEDNILHYHYECAKSTGRLD